MSFGKRLRKARTEKHLTQKQLAELLSVKHNSISNWENDINKPDPDTIELICGVLEITPNYLLATTSEDFSPAEKLIIKKYRALDEKGREMVNTILDNEYERYLQRIEMEKNLPPFFKMLEEMEQQQTHKTINEQSKVYQFDVSPAPSMVADSAVPYTTAARNDFINEPGELEKTERDIKKLKRPE